MTVSLKVTSLDPELNTKTTNINYINPNVTDATLKEFATELFSHSNNTLQTIEKVVNENITNAQEG